MHNTHTLQKKTEFKIRQIQTRLVHLYILNEHLLEIPRTNMIYLRSKNFKIPNRKVNQNTSILNQKNIQSSYYLKRP